MSARWEARNKLLTPGWLNIFPVIYEAKDEAEFRALGGLRDPRENSRVRSISGKISGLNRQTGQASIRLQTGKLVQDVPFDEDRGIFPDYTPGTWEMMTG